MSIDAKRRYAAAAFITLLLLSVAWPSPIVSSNRLWWNDSMAIDEFSFLGREAPSWDVVFWCIAGLLTLAIVQTGQITSDTTRHELARLRSLRPAWRRLAIAIVIALACIFATWRVIDRPVVAWAELVQSEELEAGIRLTNRLGGGMNPPMIVLFFLVAGATYAHRRWVTYAIAMAVAGLGAGLFAHILKLLFGRTRPELWLGPFHFARGGANSFPSGHTVGAFALAGVLMFLSPSKSLRVVAFLLAAMVGMSRVIAFRHWPSDVVASALIGLLAAWVCTRGVTEVTSAGASNP